MHWAAYLIPTYALCRYIPKSAAKIDIIGAKMNDEHGVQKDRLNEGLANHVARFMSYAYQRGKLDASGFPDCKEKEVTIKKIGDLEAEKWLCSAQALLDMNGYDC